MLGGRQRTEKSEERGKRELCVCDEDFLQAVLLPVSCGLSLTC